MNFNNLEEIKKAGFTGFKTMRELFVDNSAIPKMKGVYLVINPTKQAEFLPIGTGGYFRGKNPNVSINELKSNWVDDTLVVYIGKAGSETGSATLNSRLKQYIRFGQGADVGHYGGRLIWQLKNSADLVVCWKTLSKDEPRVIEGELIESFKQQHNGKRPFANLQD